MRYLRTRQSYCLYTKDVHLYVFPWNKGVTKEGRKVDSGFTVKRRRKDDMWRHYTIRGRIRLEDSVIFHAEAVTHLSSSWGHGRISRTKRYVRFKVCI